MEDPCDIIESDSLPKEEVGIDQSCGSRSPALEELFPDGNSIVNAEAEPKGAIGCEPLTGEAVASPRALQRRVKSDSAIGPLTEVELEEIVRRVRAVGIRVAQPSRTRSVTIWAYPVIQSALMAGRLCRYQGSMDLAGIASDECECIGNWLSDSVDG